MSLIKPRTRGKHMVRLVSRLDRENDDTLRSYAEFLGEPVEYVLNELIDMFLTKDKDFIKWRSERPGRTSPRPARERERDGSLTAASSTGPQPGMNATLPPREERPSPRF